MEVLEGEIGHGTGKLSVYAQSGVKVERFRECLGMDKDVIRSIGELFCLWFLYLGDVLCFRRW